MAGDVQSSKIVEIRLGEKRCLLIEEDGKLFKVCGEYDPILDGVINIIVGRKYGKRKWDEVGEHVQIMNTADIETRR